MKTKNSLRVIVAVAVAGAAAISIGHLSGGATANAAPPNSPSAAALAKAPVNRGKLVGAPCQPSDGYRPDFSKLEAKAEAKRRQPGGANRPYNLLDFVDADTPVPLERHQLPPGRAYCLQSQESQDGYLTMNCKVDADCPAPATCGGTVCRAACTSDADCVAPNVCSNAGAGGVSYCRCDDCTKEKNEAKRGRARTKPRRSK